MGCHDLRERRRAIRRSAPRHRFALANAMRVKGFYHWVFTPWRWLQRTIGLFLCKELLSDATYGPKDLLGLFPAISRRLAEAGWTRFNTAHYFYMEDGIELTEAAWKLSREAEVACRLGPMLERANRNADAIEVYREGFRLHPGHARLRHQCAIQLLRHGAPEDVTAFVAAVRQVDPADTFCGFIEQAMGLFPRWVEEISRALRERSAGRQALLLSFAVWGGSYVAEFMNYACAALLAPGNIGAASRRHEVRLVLFTTLESEPAIRAHPNYARLAAQAAVQFVHFPGAWQRHAEEMTAHYGEELGRKYAIDCKFVLFSCANYSALEAARQADALVVPLAADNVLNDGALDHLTRTLEGPYDAVVAAGFRVPARGIKPDVDRHYRTTDGLIRIPSEEYAKLLNKHLPPNNFVDSREFTHFPLMLCWRVGEEGFLAHANHLHPCCIRASGLNGPLHVSTDPVDGRFLSRYLRDPERIHIVQDSRVILADWGDMPLVVAPSRAEISTNAVALWLRMYWDDLRERYFRTPIRIGIADDESQWDVTESRAIALIDAILSESKRRETADRGRVQIGGVRK